MTQFPTPPFEVMRSYDVPVTITGMLLDNELTARGAQNALFEPAALSPKERETYVNRIKERVGGGRVGDALVGLATNPLVWLSFITSAPAGTALKQAGKGLFSGGRSASAYVIERTPMLLALGAGTANHIYEGTKVVPVLQQIGKGIHALDQGLARRLEPAIQRVIASSGLKKGLDITEYLEGTPERETAERLMFALQGSIEGLDREAVSYIPRLRSRKGAFRGKSIAQRLYAKKVVEAPLVSADLERELGRWDGAKELRDAFNQEKFARLKLMWGKDGEAGFVTDPDKALRVYRVLTAPVVGQGAMAHVGMDLVQEIMGPEVRKMLTQADKKGNPKLTYDEFLNVIKQTVEIPLKGDKGYFPRNLWATLETGEKESVLLARRNLPLQATKSAIPRAPYASSLLPEELEKLAGHFGEGDGFEAAYERASNVFGKQRPGQRMRRLNPWESLDGYFDQTGRTWAFAVQQPNAAVKLAIDETDKFIPASSLATGRAEKDLRGGMGLGDHLQEAFEQLRLGQRGEGKSSFSQDMLKNVHLPLVMGRMTVEHAASLAAMQTAKRWVGAVADGPLGRVMAKSGAWGDKLVTQMKELAEKETTAGQGRTMAGQIARYLYLTHLGINLGSASLNMMQPLLLAGPQVGARSLAKGYYEASRELGTYLKARAEQGFKPQTFAAKNETVKKFFKHADFDGEDLLGITRDFEENLDAISRHGTALGKAAEKESLFWHYPMKAFEKAEWMNRLVTAHAVEDQFVRAGRDISQGVERTRMAGDIKRMVSETQFGGDVFSTPTAFLGHGPFGRILNNPLFRQFATFYSRMAVAPALFSPKVAGGVREAGFMGIPLFTTKTPAVAGAFDALRGLGYSAVVYELGKSLLGADLSPGLYASSISGIVGGDRFLQDGNDWLRLPPVVSIPVDLTRGLLGGDYELLQRTVPRLLPGGVALSRAMGVLPDLPDTALAGLPGSLQKTFVDYAHPTPDGRLATYKGDGTLIGYLPKMEIYGKALGLDLGRFKDQGEFDHFLLKNQEEKRDYARRATGYLLSNQSDRARGVASEFQRRFGYPLRVSREQMKAAMEVRSKPRTERILENMPPEMKPVYQEVLRKSMAGTRVGVGPVVPDVSEGGEGQLPGNTGGPFGTFNPYTLPSLP